MHALMYLCGLKKKKKVSWQRRTTSACTADIWWTLMETGREIVAGQPVSEGKSVCFPAFSSFLCTAAVEGLILF